MTLELVISVSTVTSSGNRFQGFTGGPKLIRKAFWEVGPWAPTLSQTCPCFSIPTATSPVLPLPTPTWMPTVASLWGSLAPSLPLSHHSISLQQPERVFQDTNWMLAFSCLKSLQAHHPVSDKIRTFQLSLQDLYGQDLTFSSTASPPKVLFTFLLPFCPLIV